MIEISQKKYKQWDRTYMIFGSLMNGLKTKIGPLGDDEAFKLIARAWEWAQSHNEAYVDKFFGGVERVNEKLKGQKESPLITQEGEPF